MQWLQALARRATARRVRSCHAPASPGAVAVAWWCGAPAAQHSLLSTSTSGTASSNDSSSTFEAKWRSLLSQGAPHAPSADTLRQLLREAIAVFKADGATAVVPDAAASVCMAAYRQRQQQPQQQLAFFQMLAADFGVQRDAVDAAVQLWLNRAGSAGDGDDAAAAAAGLMFRLADRLAAAAQPLYLQLLLPISQVDGGLAFLVQLRGDLLRLLRETPAVQLGGTGPALRALDQDLRAALARWFSPGLLQLQRISWEDSPGALLQRVLAAEAVHRMHSLEQLQRRLQQSDRRVFAFLHASMPGQPLVVLHTAILDAIPDSMATVLAPGDGGSSSTASSSPSSSTASSTTGSSSPSSPASSSSHPGTVACFYSISLAASGLHGVDLGNMLIKRAAGLLLADPALPHLTTLATLSPVPGFRAWLVTRLQQQQQAAGGGGGSSHSSDAPAAAASGDSGSSDDDTAPLLQPEDAAGILDALSWLHSSSSSSAQQERGHPSSSGGGGSTAGGTAAAASAAAAGLLQLLSGDAWRRLPSAQQQAVLRPLLLRLCARYLTAGRRRGLALDPVAHFHLRNGAQLWRINWSANLSEQGLATGVGLMVNYRYDLAQVSARNAAYLAPPHHIAASPEVMSLW